MLKGLIYNFFYIQVVHTEDICCIFVNGLLGIQHLQQDVATSVNTIDLLLTDYRLGNTYVSIRSFNITLFQSIKRILNY